MLHAGRLTSTEWPKWAVLVAFRAVARGDAVLIAASVVVLLIGVPLVVNALTPRPYVALFRALIGQVESSVQLGPYAGRVDRMPAGRTVDVPVPNEPDARLTISSPTSAGPHPVLLLIHGGGWVVGRADQIEDYAKLLASSGIVVANLDYSLAPERRYPTPVRHAAAALDYLHEHAADFGGESSELFVGGNSAGAQISAQLAAAVTSPALERSLDLDIATPPAALRGVVLYSGPYDFDTVSRDGFPGLRTYAWSYTGRKDFEQYSRLDELSIVRSATTAFPATYLTAGDADPLEPQSFELDAVLRAKGVDVTSRYWTGTGRALPHDYVFDLTTDAARTAFHDTTAFSERTRNSGSQTAISPNAPDRSDKPAFGCRYCCRCRPVRYSSSEVSKSATAHHSSGRIRARTCSRLASRRVRRGEYVGQRCWRGQGSQPWGRALSCVAMAASRCGSRRSCEPPVWKRSGLWIEPRR